MSVRRLADDTVQPESFSFNRANAAWAKRKLKNYPKGRQASAVIPLLMRAQEQEGWVTKPAIEHVAEMLDMPLIRVLEVATFYTQFQLAPVGTRAHVQICGTTPCMLRGSEDLIRLCRKRIHAEPFHTNADGTLSWEEVECQGACVNAPMVMIFKDTYEDLTPERLDEILDEFEAGRGSKVTPGPQVDRIYSAPEGGLTALTGTPLAGGKSATSRRASPQPATKAAKPDQRAEIANPAVKTPVSRKRAKAAQEKARGSTSTAATKARKDAAAKKPVASKFTAEQSEPGKPQGMRKPAKPDDLKLISGVGPKIEGLLNDLGIWKFEQIAKWKKAERDWVDGYLRFKGRIERDEWTRQAKALAKGGRDEYVRVFGKEPR